MEKKKLDQLENVRAVLYKYVDGIPSRLSRPEVLPMSMLLDELVIEIQKDKRH